MATSQINEVIQHLSRTVLLWDGAGLTDGQLLESFISRREEAAVAALVRRHGPMVWSVCRRLLSSHQDAEDAFQATFLVFLRKAASIMPREMVANWLFGVARQTALKAKQIAAKRSGRERQVNNMPEPKDIEEDGSLDLHLLLDQELSRLPDKYRCVIVLCDLQGKTRKEAARQLGVPEGTIASRMATARTRLAKRLSRHGLAVSGASLTAALLQNVASASVPTPVLASTIKAVTMVAAGETVAAGLISANVAAVTEEVVKAMLLTRLKIVTTMVLLAMCVVGLGGVLTYCVMAADFIAQASNPPKTDETIEPEKLSVPKKEVNDQIQGTWDVTRIEVDGEVRNAEKGGVWTISKDKIKWFNEERPMELTYSLDRAQIPSVIDMKVSTGAEKGAKFKGIYALEGDTLKVCYQIGGEERPKAFQTEKSNSLQGRVLLILKRKKRDADDPPKKFTNSIGMKFVWIKPGTFMMGSPKEEKERRADEPQNKVTLTKGFYMGAHTVSQEQWQEVMGNNPSHFKGEINLPVEMVSWNDCQEFVKKLREKDKKLYRLPTEAEWEFACRAGTTTPFHFGETISTDQANYIGEAVYGDGKKGVWRKKTTPVGNFPANAWGLHDMHGNVWQWCQDWYDDYPQNDVVDPQGPNKGQYRVYRGGSWGDGPVNCRSAHRFGSVPGVHRSHVGCRLCFFVE